MTREEIAIGAWDNGFWFAMLRTRRISPYSASKGRAFRCAELIGHDRYLVKVDSRYSGGKGR